MSRPICASAPPPRYAAPAMVVALGELDVLVIDCQAGGATPAHGDLLEIGWAVCGRDGLRGPIHQHFIIPRTDRRVPAPIRELTGWSEACIADAVPEQTAWSALQADIARVAVQSAELERAPAAIHFARFELPFLRDLHERLGAAGGAFPIDAICLHAIAARLFPDLPRRNIRALAGYLGHSTDLLRRCASHVQASAFIWRALVPELERAGVFTLSELAAWLGQAAPERPRRRVYPLAAERRRALPDRPGVYRFLRRNGDVLYVGKAASLKKRVAGHFAAGRQANERALELLTQVHDIAVTETASVLEAALLESDEIKRIDPPYNVQLRSGERCAWFATRDLRDAAAAPDGDHRIGPLPSRSALIGLHALIALVDGADPAPALQACALAVPVAFLPDPALFAEGFRAFASAHLARPASSARARVDRAARALWLLRRRSETESAAEDPPATGWDLARVLRRLERSLVQTGLLLRRARFLCLLADADVAFREREMSGARALRVARGCVIEQRELARALDIAALPPRRVPALAERQACFDAACYDRLRVLATELNRVQAEGGELALRLGARVFSGERLAGLMRWV